VFVCWREKKICVELEQKRRESTAEDPDSPTSSLHHQKSQKRKSFRQISIGFVTERACVRARSLNNSQQATQQYRALAVVVVGGGGEPIDARWLAAAGGRGRRRAVCAV